MGYFIFLPLFLLCFASHICAQNLTWQFAGNVGLNLPQCGSLPVNVTSTSSSSAAKTSYYMIALAADGTPTTSLIGAAGGDLSWTVNQPVGSNLLLYVIDLTGRSAPTSPSFYTVIAGQSPNCNIPSTSSSFTVSANATSNIQTCDPWSLRIRGGTAPYTVTLVALASPSVTNITMPSGDNQYTYINRALPKSTLVAAISDSTGKWATGTPYVTTEGTSETACSGQDSTSAKVSLPDTSSSASSSSITQPIGTPSSTPDASSGSKKSSNKTSIIVGVVVSVVGALLIAALVFWFLSRMRSRSSRAPFLEAREVNPFISSSEAINMVSVKPPTTSAASPSSLRPSYSPSSAGSWATPHATTSTTLAPLRKTEARANHTTSPSSPDSVAEMVIQHRDGRAVNVKEFPPPYGTQNGK